MLKKVLVAVDGSIISRKVVEFARALAGPSGAGLAVLYVVEPVREDLSGQFGISGGDLRHALLREGQQLVESVCQDLGLADAERLVQVGQPSQTICSEAEDWQADVIVLGAHGQGGGPRVMLGSVGHRVANLASRPVTIVR